MKQLYYTFQTLIRGRSSSVTRIISLTLGLSIAILLFARIAFELNYNKGYKDPDRLCVILATYTINGFKDGPINVTMGPVAKTIGEAFPDKIELFTTIMDKDYKTYFLGETPYTSYHTILGDTTFFQTMGITVLKGNTLDLANPDIIFISEDFARQVFGNEDPIGRTLMCNKKQEVTVKGVFVGLPENNAVRSDVIMSFASLFKYNWRSYGWWGGDSFKGFIRLRPGVKIEEINPHINAVIENYMPYDPEKYGWGVQYEIQYLHDSYVDNPDTQRFTKLLFALGFSILLIVAFNCVLISISSLALRAKGIGVHKCNGATTSNIFSMFMWETALIVGISLLLMLIMVFSFKETIEVLMGVSLASLFVWETMWVPISVILFLFLVTGILPGRMFSNIPVTQIFRRYTEGKQNWKRTLLFIQFAGISFIFGLLSVVWIQYNELIDYNLGYEAEGVAATRFRFDNPETGKNTIAQLPMVEKVALSNALVGDGLPGEAVIGPDGKVLFSTRFYTCDYDFIPLLGIHMKEGRNINGPNQVLVNEEFVRNRKWTDSAIGKQASKIDKGYGNTTIVGVIDNYVLESLFAPMQPVMITYLPEWFNCITVRLKQPYRENLDALNQAVKEIFPTERIAFTYVPDTIKEKYSSVEHFRNIVILAFAATLLITLMVLIGYINDEVRRRSKEIAIRKVNGAEAYDILTLLSKNIIWVALPAVMLGTISSYYISKEWLGQFEGFRISLNLPMFILIAIGILTIILVTVIAQSWRISNENPINNIKNE